MKEIKLGLGEIGMITQPGSKLRTIALGSCIAVVLLHPKLKVAGMIHVVLPDGKANPVKASASPGYFADTGIHALLKQAAKLGCNPGRKGLLVKLIGGAQITDPNGVFNIGKRNLLAIKKNLWKFRMGAIAEDVGGSISRTVSVSADSGDVFISSPGRKNWTI